MISTVKVEFVMEKAIQRDTHILIDTSLCLFKSSRPILHKTISLR